MRALVCFTLVYFLESWALCGVRGQSAVNQTKLDILAQSLKVTWTVVTNTLQVYRLEATMTLENTGSETLDYGEWQLYWYSVYPVEPDHLQYPGDSMELAGQGLLLKVVNGMLLYLQPTSAFRPLSPGASRVLRFKIKYWSVARSDQFPNWYLTGSSGTNPRILTSTSGTDPPFVTPSRSPQQQKRYDFDRYTDRSPQQRYHRNYVPYAAPEAELRLIPKPWQVTFQGGSDVRLSTAWKIWADASSGSLNNELNFLLDSLASKGLNLQATSSAPSTYVIKLMQGTIVIADNDVMDESDEAYSVEVDAISKVVTIKGRGPSGVLLGCQTLLSVMKQDWTLPAMTVYDAPRFRFRGLFLDIGRNFRSAEEIKRYLRVMAMYKLNRLHLHLSEDEGWRIPIPDLPELTELGSKRCHDPSEDVCLLPQLGSGPEATYPGSGFLTSSEYRDILSTAKRLHIEVIPEIDMPGHSRAAIKAMELRYRKYMKQNNVAEAERYRLIEPNNTSRYVTAQFFNDNTVNVCMESVYHFVTKVVTELQRLHSQVQELKEFHIGLDEVEGAWVNSSLCQQLKNTNTLANSSLKMYFFQRVSEITSSRGLKLGGWEDGLMLKDNQPFNRSVAQNTEVYANVWNSVWEWGSAARTHNLANNGYKVVMSHGTNLYFDHPYEPHWEERGYYWATRFTDTQKVFRFLPMNYYANIEEKVTGAPLSREEVCGEGDLHCPPLRQPQNIVGMQGNLWAETVRTGDQADSQLFPRVLALAERAWHFAAWEKTSNVTLRQQMMTQDWYSFARAVGYRELPRLDRLGIKYRIPPPGAVVERGRVKVSGGYPGLQVEYSTDWGHRWRSVDGTQTLKDTERLWLRTRSADGKRFSRIVELPGRPEPPATPQSVLDYMGEHLQVQYEVTDNYLRYGDDRFVATLFLNNTGNQSIPAGNWQLQFPSVQWLEPELLREEREFILQDHKMALSHVQGYLFRLSPLYDFPPLEPGAGMAIELRAEFWSASKYEQFPNYFVVAEGANPRVIRNTADESMSFVRNFSKVNQWKRSFTDRFDPLTPSARYGKQSDVNILSWAPLPYLPTPLSFQMDRSKTVSLKKNWVVVVPAEWLEMGKFIQEQLNGSHFTVMTGASPPQSPSPSPYILLQKSTDGVPFCEWPGAYNISVNPTQEAIVISANDTTGILYGIQSLTNMAMQSQDGATLFEVTARDAPRFGFRGMNLDVSRNFHSKESVLKLVTVMGLYKLNRLHLHLADDEGWRLDIPGLPELTTVGSRRCHDPTEEQCLTPVMGSGPDPNNPGSGFYTVQDYQEILRAAAKRHIEVIPEFDTPGHARAAIKAMALRRKRKLEEGDRQGAYEYALDEEGDPSVYSSVQMYDDNAVNPCLDSTYRFIRHVLLEVKKMHQPYNPLRVYHFGGDEVASGAWIHSKACSALTANGTDLKFLYSTRMAAIAAEAGVNLGCWEDGIMDHGDPIPRQDMAAGQVFVNAWQNVWEWGAASRAYYLANAGYQVILGPATHTYFDFPSEPDPNERGFYWATRYTDSRKVFGFKPQDFWSNVDINRMGEPLTLKEVCGEDNKGCPQLVRKENIVGMQGHLWSETVRTASQMDYMIFPRLLALAERVWHTGFWENQGGEERESGERRDWAMFANSLGHGQLLVLDRLNLSYRLCPPGVRQEGGELKVNTEFPGLKTQFMTSDSGEWRDVMDGKISVREGQQVDVRTMSPDGQRFSRAVTVVGAKNDVISSMASFPSSVICLPMVLLCLVFLLLSF